MRRWSESEHFAHIRRHFFTWRRQKELCRVIWKYVILGIYGQHPHNFLSILILRIQNYSVLSKHRILKEIGIGGLHTRIGQMISREMKIKAGLSWSTGRGFMATVRHLTPAMVKSSKLYKGCSWKHTRTHARTHAHTNTQNKARRKRNAAFDQGLQCNMNPEGTWRLYNVVSTTL